MTDYRARNSDLLYAAQRPQPLNWRHALIFGAIGATAAVGVVCHLTERFNAAPSGFAANVQRPVVTAEYQPPATEVAKRFP
jgi:hypothetical protein